MNDLAISPEAFNEGQGFVASQLERSIPIVRNKSEPTDPDDFRAAVEAEFTEWLAANTITKFSAALQFIQEIDAVVPRTRADEIRKAVVRRIVGSVCFKLQQNPVAPDITADDMARAERADAGKFSTFIENS